MSLLKLCNIVFIDEKEDTNLQYINIDLLCNSFWKTNDFDFARDVGKNIPSIFWTSTNIIKVFSIPKSILGGFYCEFVLAKKILRFLITKQKLFMPVNWKKMTIILPYFELGYIQKNIREYKEPYITFNKNISNESLIHTALGEIEIFPIRESIPMLLRDTFKINFYDPLEFLNITYPFLMTDSGKPLFVNKEQEKLFHNVFNEKNFLDLPDKPDNVGLRRRHFLMDSFKYQDLISFFEISKVDIDTGNICSEHHFASYKKTLFGINIISLDVSRENQVSDPVIDKTKKTEDHLILTKPKFQTPPQQLKRKKLKDRLRYTNKKKEIGLNQNLERTTDDYLLNTKPRFLTSPQKLKKRKLQDRLRHTNNKKIIEINDKLEIKTNEELLNTKPRFLTPPQNLKRSNLQKKIRRTNNKKIIEIDEKLESKTNEYLLNTKPRFLTPPQKLKRRKLQDRLRHTNNKKKIEINEKLEIKTNEDLLNTKPRSLTPPQIDNGRMLQKIIRHTNNKKKIEINENLESKTNENMLTIKPRFLTPIQNIKRKQLKDKLRYSENKEESEQNKKLVNDAKNNSEVCLLDQPLTHLTPDKEIIKKNQSPQKSYKKKEIDLTEQKIDNNLSQDHQALDEHIIPEINGDFRSICLKKPLNEDLEIKEGSDNKSPSALHAEKSNKEARRREYLEMSPSPKELLLKKRKLQFQVLDDYQRHQRKQKHKQRFDNLNVEEQNAQRLSEKKRFDNLNVEEQNAQRLSEKKRFVNLPKTKKMIQRLKEATNKPRSLKLRKKIWHTKI